MLLQLLICVTHLLLSSPLCPSESIALENTEDNRRAYRELLVTTPGLGKYISGAILFEETLFQSTSSGKKMVDCLKEQNIVPGIKVGGLPVGYLGTAGVDVSYKYLLHVVCVVASHGGLPVSKRLIGAEVTGFHDMSEGSILLFCCGNPDAADTRHTTELTTCLLPAAFSPGGQGSGAPGQQQR